MSPSKEDYIKNIFKDMEERGYSQNKNLSHYLKISKPSVTEMIKKLTEEGLVYLEGTKIYLTDEGEKVAKRLISIHRLWEYFLETVLDFDEEDVHSQADLLEHVTSDKLMDSLNKYMGYPKNCPHNQKIYLNLENDEE